MLNKKQCPPAAFCCSECTVCSCHFLQPLHLFVSLVNKSLHWKITLMHYISSKLAYKFLALSACTLWGVVEPHSINRGCPFNLHWCHFFAGSPRIKPRTAQDGRRSCLFVINQKERQKKSQGAGGQHQLRRPDKVSSWRRMESLWMGTLENKAGPKWKVA